MAIAREVAAVTRLGIEVAQPLYAYKILFYMIPCLISIEFRIICLLFGEIQIH